MGVTFVDKVEIDVLCRDTIEDSLLKFNLLDCNEFSYEEATDLYYDKRLITIDGRILYNRNWAKTIRDKLQDKRCKNILDVEIYVGSDFTQRVLKVICVNDRILELRCVGAMTIGFCDTRLNSINN